MNQDIIEHFTYGRGRILETRASGFELRVSFESGATRWVRRDAIQLLTPLPALPTVTSQPTSRQRHGKGPRPSRRIIEALRLGIVPDSAIERFTFGRDAEIDTLKAWLTAKQDGARFIVGSYGTGKTHVLNYLRFHAMRQGFAVAFAEMDSLEAPFARPKRVYGQLVQNLRYCLPGQTKILRFRDLVRSAFSAGLLHDHAYFSHLWRAPQDERSWQWIEACEDVPRPQDSQGAFNDGLPGLYNYGTAANIYCYLLSTLGSICRHPRVGLKGLLLIFDEAETLFARQTYAANQSSYNFLGALTLVSNDNPIMLHKPEDIGFEYAARASDIPFLYRQPSGLKVALAFTDIQDLRYSPILGAVPALTLDPIDDDALVAVFAQVRELYRLAYRYDTRHVPVDDLHDIVSWHPGPTRMHIKRYIEALDLIRFHPQLDVDEVLA